MELWKIMANDSGETEKILNFYFELRKEFQDLDFSEDDLSSPPHYSNKMFQLKSLIGANFNNLLNKINNYGFDINSKELEKYLEHKFLKINELTPLKDGDKKRDDRRNKNN